MAVQNSITKTESPKKEMKCVYKSGDNEVTLTPQFVKQYLTTGENASHVTAQEVVMFINLCKYQQLNPFTREAYLIKYSKSEPANLVVGKAAFEARAERDERYEGYDAGIVVQKKNGELEYRKGTLVLPDERLVGGWAEVYVKGYTKPIYTAVSLAEYSTGKSTWAQKPATMIRKVAKMQALREAFPNALGSMYTAEELGHSDEELPVQSIEQPQEEVQSPADVVVIQPELEVLDGSDLL